MIARLKSWQFHWRRKKMEKWLADPSSGMNMVLNNVATKLALQMVTNWLNMKKILHCEMCPATETLQKFAGNYFCPGHYAMVNEQYEKDMKAEKEKAVA